MNLLILPILFLGISIHATAQVYIGKTRSHVLNKLNEKAGPGNKTVTASSAGISFEFGTESSCRIKTFFKFDQAEKTSSQEFTSLNDSCFSQSLQQILGVKKYGWKKINENQYVSGFKHYLMIELPVEKGDFSFTLFKAEWNKDTYKILTGH